MSIPLSQRPGPVQIAPGLSLPDGATGFVTDDGQSWQCTGSMMGRSNVLPDDPVQRLLTCKLRMVRLKWVDGDYDSAGTYWGGGNGDSIYYATGDCGDVQAKVFVRAKSRNEAKSLVREFLPRACFFG